MSQPSLNRNRCGLPLAALLAPFAVTALADGMPLMSGEQVFESACRQCHAGGLAGAPRYGDETSWQALITEGQAALTAHGWVGVRAMPPKGGRDDLELEEFARAVAYMARAGGADWQDPDDALLARIRVEIDKRIADLAARRAAEQ